MSDAAPADRPPQTISWLSELRAGVPRGWGRFVEVYGPVVREWCRQMGLQQADADDVAQEVLVKAGQGIASFGVGGNFVGWLYAVTRNAVRDHFRRRAD